MPLPTPKTRRAPGPVSDGRPDRHVEAGVASGRRPADRAGVDTPRRDLALPQDPHAAPLRRAGHGGTGEQGRHQLGERRAAAGRHRGGHLEQRRIALHLEQRSDRDAADLGDAAEIVAQHVDDHDVLGAVLLGRLERGHLARVLLGRAAARGRALHRPGRQRPPVTPEEELRRRGHDRETAEIEVGGVARPLHRHQPHEELERVLVERRQQGEREVRLVAVARRDPLVQPCDDRRVARCGKRRLPARREAAGPARGGAARTPGARRRHPARRGAVHRHPAPACRGRTRRRLRRRDIRRPSGRARAPHPPAPARARPRAPRGPRAPPRVARTRGSDRRPAPARAARPSPRR